jgi:hypothetical protein
MEKILTNKRTLVNPQDGIVIKDLIEPSYEFGIERVPIKEVAFVTSQMTCRTDLFAGVYSGNESDEWVILKYNRISNPFTVNEGDILAIPQIGNVENLELTEIKRSKNNPSFERSKENIKKELRRQYNPFTKENIKSTSFDSFKNKYARLQEQKDLEEAKKLQTGDSLDSKDLLPPNFADRNKKEITVSPNGTVILGTSVADTDTSCGKNTLTKAELVNSLIKNRIVR